MSNLSDSSSVNPSTRTVTGPNVPLILIGVIARTMEGLPSHWGEIVGRAIFVSSP